MARENPVTITFTFRQLEEMRKALQRYSYQRPYTHKGARQVESAIAKIGVRLGKIRGNRGWKLEPNV